MKIPEFAIDDATDVTKRFAEYWCDALDHRYGPDYAKKNPQFVAALVQATAYTFRTHLQNGADEE